MKNVLFIVPIFFPILCGFLIEAFKFKKAAVRERYVSTVVILNSLIIFGLFFLNIKEPLMILNLGGNFSISFHIDGLSKVFGGLLAGLWPLATIYAFEYMKHEGKENPFFMFYVATYGIAVGIAFSANLITMYLFYEVLTFITLPIIMHEMDAKAIHAGRKYLIYSVAGAAAAFMAIMVLYYYANSLNFQYGGVLSAKDITSAPHWLYGAYIVAFLGFGVKAAVFPLHGWLPTAGVAPTPVTALLHAVAVVKAGVFAIIRITYFSFGTDFLYGSWAHYVVMGLAIVTIVYGSSMAVKEQHFKRRLAYSTVSNLSYIVFGVTLMTPQGLTAGLSHMIFHGIMKICLFFCAGAVICKTHKQYVYQLRGFGKKMPVTFACFTIGSIALVGVPGFCGFISKWNLATAATGSGMVFSYLGVLALIISAILTAIYLFSIVTTAYFPGNDFDYDTIRDVEDPTNYMKIPLIILCTVMLLFGLFSGPLMTFFQNVASGLV